MFHDSEICSQAGRGVPVSIRNLVRQVTVHLAGEDGREGGGQECGGVEGAREYETTYKRTTVITVIIVTTIIFFCLIILVTFILEMIKFAEF